MSPRTSARVPKEKRRYYGEDAADPPSSPRRDGNPKRHKKGSAGVTRREKQEAKTAKKSEKSTFDVKLSESDAAKRIIEDIKSGKNVLTGEYRESLSNMNVDIEDKVCGASFRETLTAAYSKLYHGRETQTEVFWQACEEELKAALQSKDQKALQTDTARILLPYIIICVAIEYPEALIRFKQIRQSDDPSLFTLSDIFPEYTGSLDSGCVYLYEFLGRVEALKGAVTDVASQLTARGNLYGGMFDKRAGAALDKLPADTMATATYTGAADGSNQGERFQSHEAGDSADGSGLCHPFMNTSKGIEAISMKNLTVISPEMVQRIIEVTGAAKSDVVYVGEAYVAHVRRSGISAGGVGLNIMCCAAVLLGVFGSLTLMVTLFSKAAFEKYLSQRGIAMPTGEAYSVALQEFQKSHSVTWISEINNNPVLIGAAEQIAAVLEVSVVQISIFLLLSCFCSYSGGLGGKDGKRINMEAAIEKARVARESGAAPEVIAALDANTATETSKYTNANEGKGTKKGTGWRLNGATIGLATDNNLRAPGGDKLYISVIWFDGSEWVQAPVEKNPYWQNVQKSVGTYVFQLPVRFRKLAGLNLASVTCSLTGDLEQPKAAMVLQAGDESNMSGLTGWPTSRPNLFRIVQG